MQMSEESAKTKTTNELAQERTDLASDRTRWAADRTLWADDRTLIAWVRTSLALIGFGFGVGRALEYLEKFDRETDPYHSAMIFGASFILLGILGLLGAIVQHVRIERRLIEMGYHRGEPVPLGLLTAVILLLIGVFALVMVLVNP
jgi:putative membrane protein